MHCPRCKFLGNMRTVLSVQMMKIGNTSHASGAKSEVDQRPKKLKFSESGAYSGMDRPVEQGDQVPFQSGTSVYGREAAASFFGSLAVLCIYFWYTRRNDVSILDTPKHVIVPLLKRYAIRQEIERAQKKHKDTTLLEATLAYVDVEEAILKAEDDGII